MGVPSQSRASSSCCPGTDHFGGEHRGLSGTLAPTYHESVSRAPRCFRRWSCQSNNTGCIDYMHKARRRGHRGHTRGAEGLGRACDRTRRTNNDGVPHSGSSRHESEIPYIWIGGKSRGARDGVDATASPYPDAMLRSRASHAMLRPPSDSPRRDSRASPQLNPGCSVPGHPIRLLLRHSSLQWPVQVMPLCLLSLLAVACWRRRSPPIYPRSAVVPARAHGVRTDQGDRNAGPGSDADAGVRRR